MAKGVENGSPNGAGAATSTQIRFVPLTYSADDSNASALRLVTAIRPEWEGESSRVEFVRFTDGITNTLLKAVLRRDGLSKEDADREAILLRAYGHGTDELIDRQRELQNHVLLMHHGLAPELLARFHNGMLYRFVRGSVTHPEDLRKPVISAAIARRLAQWHATVPCIPGPTRHRRKSSSNKVTSENGLKGLSDREMEELSDQDFQAAIDGVAPGKPPPNVWTVMQKWIFGLPTETEAQRTRQADLQKELTKLVTDLSQRPGLGKNGLVFAHCDLLSGNVIILPKATKDATETATFIDYEYATPSPAAFDISNHFAEWGGFECDYSVLPTRGQRRAFVEEYARSYFHHHGEDGSCPLTDADLESHVDNLMAEIDIFRGVPGFYWGIWALIQAKISEIDFDYANYAEVRLAEYYAWRAELDGSREKSGAEMPVRERRWADE